MTTTISLDDFTSKVKRLIDEHAQQSGLPASELTNHIAQSLLWYGLEERQNAVPQQEAIPDQEAAGQPTLADVLAGQIGTVHSGRGDLSRNTGKAFAQLMVEKRKAGRL